MNKFISIHFLQVAIFLFCFHFLFEIIHAQTTPYADGFSYPIGCGRKYTQATDGDGWKDEQDFTENNHLGEDWNLESGGNSDCHQNLIAVSSGRVEYSSLVDTCWGNVVIIRHKLSDGSEIESMYGHLKNVFVYEGQNISRGDIIGTIGGDDLICPKTGQMYCHLHLEMRTPTSNSWGIPGVGYSSNTTGWFDPSNYIDSNKPRLINDGTQIYGGEANSTKNFYLNFFLPNVNITTANLTEFKIGSYFFFNSVFQSLESLGNGYYRVKINLPTDLTTSSYGSYFTNLKNYDISFKVNHNGFTYQYKGYDQFYFLEPNIGIPTANYGTYYSAYLNLAVYNGLYKGSPLNGNPFGNINPNGLITRAEAAKVICLIGLQSGYFKSLNTTPSANNYNMDGCEWYFPYVQTLINRGVFGGIGDFQPDNHMKYGELCKWLVNTFALESNCADLSKCDNYAGNYCTAATGTWEPYVKIIEESFTRINFLNVNGALPIDNIGTFRNLKLNGSISNTANCNQYIDRKDAAKLFVGTLRYIPLGGVNSSIAPTLKTSITDVSNWNVIGTKPRLPGNSPNQIPSLPNSGSLGTINDNEFWQSNVGSLYDNNGNALVYYWSIEGGELESLNDTHHNHIKWIPPTVTETTTFELYVWVGNTKGNYAHTVGTITVNPTDLNCDAPTGLSKQTTSNTQTTLNWEASSDINEYTLRYKITGNSWTNINNYTGASYPLTTSPCSSYQFEVKANCEDGSTTDWASISFSSLCQNATVNVSNFQVTTTTIFNPYVGLSWTRGNGEGLVILAKEVGTGDGTFDAPQNGTWYDGNANFSSAPPVFGGSNTKVVYNGTGTSSNVIALENGKTYLFKAYEYVGDSDDNVIYLIQGAPLNNATIEDEATIIANFDWYPVEILAGSPIEFSGFGDWVTDGQWNFNGANVTNPSGMTIENVTFANPGIYDVTFTGISSSASGSSSITKSINVLDPNNLGPDLRVKSIVLSQSSVMQDTDVEVTITVQNIGTEDVIYPWTKHWLSEDADLDANDYYFAGTNYQQSEVIQPQTEYTYTITLTIPDNGDWSNTGQNYLIVEADFPENIDETNEDNNTKSQGFTIEAFLPDIVAQSASVSPTTVASSEEITLTYAVSSNGSSSFIISAALSVDNIYNSSGEIYYYTFTNQSFFGQSTSIDLEIPSFLADGNYYLIYKVDWNNQYDETNEDNNYSNALPITISTSNQPTSEPTNFQISNIGDGTATFSWLTNSDKALLLAGEYAATIPCDNEFYAANSDYSLAPQICDEGVQSSEANKALYYGTGTSVSSTNLPSNTDIRVRVYAADEYNNNVDYLQDSYDYYSSKYYMFKAVADNDVVNNWESLAYKGFLHISFVDETNIFLADYGRLFHSTDGGKVWKVTLSFNQYTSSIIKLVLLAEKIPKS